MRTLAKPPADTNIQTTLRELPLDKLEKLGEIFAELNKGEDATPGSEIASNDV